MRFLNLFISEFPNSQININTVANTLVKNNFDEIDNTWVLGIYNSQGENANGDDEDDNGDSCPPPATDLEEPDANDPNDPNNM